MAVCATDKLCSPYTPRIKTMFDMDQFIADCRASLVEDATHKSVREVVARAVSDPGAVLKGLGEPQRSGIQKIYHSGDLTILAAFALVYLLAAQIVLQKQEA